MPELPEVETIRRCLAPHLCGQQISRCIVRNSSLRWPVPRGLSSRLAGQTITALERRGKYLLLHLPAGTLLLHLGMTGSLCLIPAATPPGKHDHVDLVLGNHTCLRFNDPRRFGAVLWTRADPLQHPLLVDLGPEPLGPGFTGKELYQQSRGRTVAIKHFIMNSRVVVGIGNIYANEALFLAGIHPQKPAGRLSARRYQRLGNAIKQILEAALAQGGTTLRDYRDGAGNPGNFQRRLQVYGRTGEPCTVCGQPIEHFRQGQRSTYYCRKCQR
jgi:formamidopyrimidine-DNA glycosylase